MSQFKTALTICYESTATVVNTWNIFLIRSDGRRSMSPTPSSQPSRTGADSMLGNLLLLILAAIMYYISKSDDWHIE
jgi:hypothetical protein